MLDSDDSFSDDFVLDEQTLAILDAEEKKYYNNQPPKQNFEQSNNGPPASKRQRTEGGWKAAGLNKSANPWDELDGLPEVSVLHDGTYTFGAARVERSRVASALPPVVPQPAKAAPNGSTDPRSANPRAIPSVSRPPSQAANGGAKQSSTPSSIPRVKSFHVPPTSHPPDARASHAASRLAHSANPNLVAAEVEALRKQLEELRQSNLTMQKELNVALDVKFTKEGEVSVLRRGIERTAQDHAAQIIKLRAAKEQADAKQATMQKEMKEEIERLRTQFTFKQHEMETSNRRAPWSIRTSKIAKEVPMTPVRLPPQMRGWSQTDDRAVPSRIAGETPSRPHFGAIMKDSPVILKPGRKQNGHPNFKEAATLPGFQNSFISSPPVRPLARKGKERADTDDVTGGFPISASSGLPISPPSSPTRRPSLHTQNDVLIDRGSPEYDKGFTDQADAGIEMLDPLPPDELDDFDPPNWEDDFPRILLTHRASPSAAITFQLVATASLPTTLPPALAETYSSASSRILEALANISCDFNSAVNAVASSFAQMLPVLSSASVLKPLAALLNLMTLLAYAFSSFSAALLALTSTSASNDQPSSKIVDALSAIVQEHIVPPKDVGHGAETTSLARECIALLECLCWNVPERFQDQLATIPQCAGLMSALLHPSQPPWLLHRSCRLLTLLSTYPKLFRILLAYPSNATDEGRGKDPTKISHVERLCTYLVDTSRQGEDADAMRTSILTFIAMMSIAHADALAMLRQIHTLIPYLVVFLTQVTSLLWEDDETLMASPSIATSSVRTLNQTLFLLHHLVFDAKPAFNLQHSLQVAAPHRRFNGITHMFIVTLGRLSYADPPEWVESAARAELEQLIEMARDLLDHVVEGPEGDSIWTAYQGSLEQEDTGDDEEMARLLDSNET